MGSQAVLCERVLLEGRPSIKVVCQIARYIEDRQDDLAEREFFWSQARKRLGRMSRLKPRDIWQIETLLAKRIPKAKSEGNIPACGNNLRPSANPIRGPHSPIERVLPRR